MSSTRRTGLPSSRRKAFNGSEVDPFGGHRPQTGTSSGLTSDPGRPNPRLEPKRATRGRYGQSTLVRPARAQPKHKQSRRGPVGRQPNRVLPVRHDSPPLSGPAIRSCHRLLAIPYIASSMAYEAALQTSTLRAAQNKTRPARTYFSAAQVATWIGMHDPEACSSPFLGSAAFYVQLALNTSDRNDNSCVGFNQPALELSRGLKRRLHEHG